MFVTCANAADSRTYHYACNSGDNRYALTVNTKRGIVTLAQHFPPHSHTNFRILKVIPEECGKYGWKLSDGATFCTATQGVGTLTWHGDELECDQADTE